MRENKFRVWDKVRSEWFSLKNAMAFLLNNDNKENLIFITKDGPYSIPQTDQDLGGRNRFEIQQFTGLLDKNGVEIYEGDILQDSLFGDTPPGLYIVEFRVSEWSSKFAITSKKNKWDYGGPVNKYLTVIGNIFENPELL